MGNISSRQEDSSRVFLRDQRRFTLSSVVITNARGRTILRLSPNAYPAERFAARKDIGDDSPVDFVQDPDSTLSGAEPSFLLRLTNDDDLNLTFNCTVRQSSSLPSPDGAVSPDLNADTNISGLTFISASTSKEIEQLVTRDFHADPNIHKNPNVNVVGDISTAGSSAVQTSYTWKWKAPKPSEDAGGGWRTTCSFVEYDQRAHSFDTLASFSFWVSNSVAPQYSPIQRSPRLETIAPPRLRVPSAQSIESRISNVSDSDGDQPGNTVLASQSPSIEPIPEYGLGLVPSTISSIGAAEKLDLGTVGRPAEDLSTTEDGPLFRATMKSLESKTGTMRSRMKRVLKTAEAAETAQSACNDAVSAFMDALREASASNANAFRPALDHYFEKIAKEILAYERQNATDLRKLIIEPINKLYNYDIKQAENKRRDFEEESKDYYAYVGKYLGKRTESLKEKKRVETDSKYESKRRTFELKRFDYSSFMHDLHGGRKDQEVLSQLTKYANSRAKGYLTTAKRVGEMVPQLEALSLEVEQVDKEFQMQRTEREEKRRALEKNPRMSMADLDTASQITSVLAGRPDPSSSPPGNVVVPMSPATATGPDGFLPIRKTSNKFKGIRDLEDKDLSELTQSQSMPIRKEGLLWSLSRPGAHIDPKGLKTAGWHKFWIVLDQGKLSEYVNWKDKLDLHMDPIDLRLASVREARNSDRSFCFEVITPQFVRTYQAPSGEDMRSWISAINNALQSAFEAKTATTSNTATADPSSRRDIAAVLTGKSTSLSGSRGGVHASKAPHRHATTGDKPAFMREITVDANALEVLNKIRNADEGNKTCADCESPHKVEWVSINLGIVLCIECSGIHRSLGTHISKIRSLTLDTSAFTPDIIDLLLLVGNRVSNMIWEARLDRFLKPAPHSTREQRLHFISSKYADRAYVEPLAALNPDDMLLTSIKRNEVQKVLQALALKANPNTQDRSRSTHAVFLALAAADPASPTSLSTPVSRQGSLTTISPTIPQPLPSRPSTPTRKPFPIAELLLQNGADIPTTAAPIPLSNAAKQYLEFKTEQRNGRLTPAAVQASLGTSPGRADGLDPTHLTPTPAMGGSPASGFSGGVGGAVGVVGVQGSRGGIEDRRTSGLRTKSGWSNSGFVGGVKALGDVGRRGG